MRTLLYSNNNVYYYPPHDQVNRSECVPIYRDAMQRRVSRFFCSTYIYILYNKMCALYGIPSLLILMHLRSAQNYGEPHRAYNKTLLINHPTHSSEWQTSSQCACCRVYFRLNLYIGHFEKRGATTVLIVHFDFLFLGSMLVLG